ncbi:MAG: hypothetical protein QM800_07310 [Paludibacter sp.]
MAKIKHNKWSIFINSFLKSGQLAIVSGQIFIWDFPSENCMAYNKKMRKQFFTIFAFSKATYIINSCLLTLPHEFSCGKPTNTFSIPTRYIALER